MMKPLSLKITAFGPYAKETTLNFKEDLADQEIFVVTGQQGLGKQRFLMRFVMHYMGKQVVEAEQEKSYVVILRLKVI